MKAAHSLQQASASMAALFASAETLVEDLGQKIDARTSAHEKEFIATYRDQMKISDQAILALEQEVHVGDASKRTVDRIQSLEADLARFADEVKSMSAANAKLQHDATLHQRRVATNDDDRRILDSILRDAENEYAELRTKVDKENRPRSDVPQVQVGGDHRFEEVRVSATVDESRYQSEFNRQTRNLDRMKNRLARAERRMTERGEESDLMKRVKECVAKEVDLMTLVDIDRIPKDILQRLNDSLSGIVL